MRQLILCIALFFSVGLQAAELTPADRDVLQRFKTSLVEHAKAQRSLAGQGEDPGVSAVVALAKERRSIMQKLIKTDPEQAWAARIGRVDRAGISPKIEKELEEDISAMGSFGVRVSRFEDGVTPSEVKRSANINGKEYNVSTWGEGLDYPSASRRSLHGVALDGELALYPKRLKQISSAEAAFAKIEKKFKDERCPISGKLAGSNQEPDDGQEDVWVESGDTVHALCSGGHITLLEGEITAAEGGDIVLNSAWTTGSKTMLYMIAKCKGDTGYPQTITSAQNNAVTVNNYFKACSWNLTDITFTIIQVDLPKTQSEYKALPDTQILTDAKAEALKKGYDVNDYNLYAVRHPKLWSWGGQGYVGWWGTWLQTDSWATAAHEYGHNYGLWHANFWNTGNKSAIGAGSNQEYGDPYSEMGGAGQFLGYEKWELDWLPTANVKTITSSGTYRIHACDTATPPQSGKFMAVRVTKDSQRDYWMTHRVEFNNKWNDNGILLHWDPWVISGVGTSNRGAQLIDTTPGTKDGKTDAAIVCGLTFSDYDAGIHITPMTLDAAASPPWVETVVNIGTFPGNNAPTVSLVASATSVPTNTAVNFTATASDPDGDPIAIHWDWGDTNFTWNKTSASKSWGTVGDYVVRVIVSDMKGKTAVASVVIRVGSVTKYRISGKVRDSGGNPVVGAWVNNGNANTSAWTNSDGEYTMVNLGAGNYTLTARLNDTTYAPLFANPVTVGPNQSDKNFGTDVPNNPPTVATPASATPNPVTTGTTTALSVLGNDESPTTLTYTWITTGSVPAPVTFSPNGTNAAKNSTATFSKAGSYPCQVTIKDTGGLTVTSSVTVIVNQSLTAITVTPASATISAGATQQFNANGVDQFGNSMSSQPSFSWAVSGGGAISGTGLFTAGSTPGGPHTVTASAGGKSGTATVTIANSPPTVVTAATASPNPVTGTTTTLSVLGGDEDASSLTYTWATTGSIPAPVNYSVNGTNAAKTSVATFTKVGSYPFQVTITDSGGLSVTSSVTVTVVATTTTVVVSPASITISPTLSQQFTATAKDQFGQTLGSQPSYSWGVSGGGTVSGSGLFTAGSTPGGPFTLTATGGGQSGTASITIANNDPPTVLVAATASPNPVNGTTTTLSVVGDDETPGTLTYTWATTGSVPAPVTYSVNGTNAAQNSVATFSKAGSYPFQVTIQDDGGLTVKSFVTVTVNQTLTSIVVTPSSATVSPLATQQYTASARDQFTDALSSQPSFTWAVSGGGSISGTGLFTAGTVTGGPHTVTATASAVDGTASVTIGINNPPTISAIANQTTYENVAVGPLNFTINDIETAASALTLTKQSSAPSLIPISNIVFGGSNSNRTVTVTPVTGQTGNATITITVTDSGGSSASEVFQVTVIPLPNFGTTAVDSGDGERKCGFGLGAMAFLLLFGMWFGLRWRNNE